MSNRMSAGEIDLLVHKYIGGDGGYLFGFSYAEHERFYVAYCNILNIDVREVRSRCGTTRRTFIAILEAASASEQASIIRGVFAKLPIENFVADVQPAKRPVFAQLEAIARRLEGNVVATTLPRATTETVTRALRDAEELLKTSGPVSALDRVHTVLQGHLVHVCRQSNIAVPPDPTITALWATLIAHHPALQIPDPRREDIKKILRSGAAVIDAINTIRNRASLAHANEILVDDAEAWLVINVARSLLHYLDQKVSAP